MTKSYADNIKIHISPTYIYVTNKYAPTYIYTHTHIYIYIELYIKFKAKNSFHDDIISLSQTKQEFIVISIAHKWNF